ncbi:MAG: hypothetical protein P8Z79_14590, partial [Sedimentisphaerales bacterium]
VVASELPFIPFSQPNSVTPKIVWQSRSISTFLVPLTSLRRHSGLEMATSPVFSSFRVHFS